MQTCSSVCAVPLPAPHIDPCAIRPRSGGISRFVLLSCDISPESITDPEAMLVAIQACKLRISPEVVGQKPQGSYEKKRLSSCRPEQIVAGEKTITFRDYNTDASGQFRDFDFWNTVLLNPQRYRLGWLTCDNTFYGFVPFSLEIDEVIEDTRNGQAYKDGTFTIEHLGLIPPVAVSQDSIDLLLANINTTCGEGEGGGGSIALYSISDVTADDDDFLLGIPESAVGSCAGPFAVAFYDPENPNNRSLTWDAFTLVSGAVEGPSDAIILQTTGESPVSEVRLWLSGCGTEVQLSLSTALLV